MTIRTQTIRRSAWSLILALVVGLTPFVVGVSHATAAAVYIVTKTADTADGACNSDCSLREAVLAANANPGADIIDLYDHTYTLTRFGSDQTALLGDLDITEQVTIYGLGAKSTIIDGGAIDRVFDIQASASDVTMEFFTIRNGQVHNTGGGGLWNYGTNTFLYRVVIRDNHDVGDTDASIGGGLRNNGTMTLQQSTVRENSSMRGGGIFNAGSSTLQVWNSTISRNTGNNVSGIQVYGTTTILDSTISSNTSASNGPSVSQDLGGTLGLFGVTIAANTGKGLSPGVGTTIGNSLISGNSGAACALAVSSSNGGNLANDASCSFSAGTDDNSLNPMIGPLRNNGGPTNTHALLPGSPAIDSGTGVCSAQDQRLADKVGACDRGAYGFVTCGGHPANLVGSINGDTLIGTSGADYAIGQGGNDTISGKGGKDRLCGGDGDDTLNGGGANDHLYGEIGTDTCNGGTGIDTAATCENLISVP